MGTAWMFNSSAERQDLLTMQQEIRQVHCEGIARGLGRLWDNGSRSRSR